MSIFVMSAGASGISVVNIGYVVGGNFSYSPGYNATAVYPSELATGVYMGG